MRKRILAILLAATFCLVLLAACAPADDAPAPTPAPTPAPADPAPTPAAPAEPVDPPDPDAIDRSQFARAPFVFPATISTELPRNETVYHFGHQWGPSNGWNPFSDDMNNPLAIDQAGAGARVPMFETPFMYNFLDGSFVPLLAIGPPRWSDDLTRVEYSINPAAFWSDGTPVTAWDAEFTFYVNNTYTASPSPHVDRVVALDELTVAIYATLTPTGAPRNPLVVGQFLIQYYIMQQAWLEQLVERNGGDIGAMQADPALDVVWSGPFTKYFVNDELTVLIRDDDYWGQHESMWGRLPTPRFLAHPVLENNDAGLAAMMAGMVDVSQMFIPNVHHLWEVEGLPISTFMDVPPFGVCVNMPTAWFNMHSEKPGIHNADFRRAIAMAVDYDLIIANAMTNQSPSFADVPRSLMNPTPGEQALFDSARVAPYQWDLQMPYVGDRIEAANALLDEAGFPRGADGWRTYDGQRLPAYVASVPFGWSDWEAAMEIVAAAGEQIGIEIVTQFDDWSIYQTIVTSAHHTDYDIFMMWTASASPTAPWERAYNIMHSDHVGHDHNWAGNWGAWTNARADEILDLIPITTGAALTDLWTELVILYLTEVPSFSLMYRPDQFHAVSEAVWTGWTEYGDGRNVPPANALNGFAIADKFNIRLVG